MTTVRDRLQAIYGTMLDGACCNDCRIPVDDVDNIMFKCKSDFNIDNYITTELKIPLGSKVYFNGLSGEVISDDDITAIKKELNSKLVNVHIAFQNLNDAFMTMDKAITDMKHAAAAKVIDRIPTLRSRCDAKMITPRMIDSSLFTTADFDELKETVAKHIASRT